MTLTQQTIKYPQHCFCSTALNPPGGIHHLDGRGGHLHKLSCRWQQRCRKSIQVLQQRALMSCAFCMEMVMNGDGDLQYFGQRY